MKIDQLPDVATTRLPVILTAQVPGRINLIGEHTDYNGGKVLPFAMNRAIHFTLSRSVEKTSWDEACYTVATRSHTGVLTIMGRELAALARHADTVHVSTDLRSLLPESIAGSWTRYAVGSLVNFWRLVLPARRPTTAAHTHIEIDSKLPHGAGISSSAALTSGIIACLLEAEGFTLDRAQIARAAMRVEHQFAGIRCGLMDQLAVLLCEKDALLLIDFLHLATSDQVTTQSIHLHPRFGAYRAVLINTMVKHELGSSPYNERRQACERGVAMMTAKLGKSYATPGHLAADPEFMRCFAGDGAQATLIKNLINFAFREDPRTAHRLAHAIMEISRVDSAVAALKTGDFAALSAAINDSHNSLAHDYEVSCPELDLLRSQTLAAATALGRERQLRDPAILGARMTGGGFGGSTIQLVHAEIVTALTEWITGDESEYVKTYNLIPDVMVTDLCDGLQFQKPEM